MSEQDPASVPSSDENLSPDLPDELSDSDALSSSALPAPLETAADLTEVTDDEVTDAEVVELVDAYAPAPATASPTAAALAETLAALEEASADAAALLASLATDAPVEASDPDSSLPVPASGSADMVKARLGKTRSELEHRRRRLIETSKQAKELLDARVRELDAVLSPLREVMSQIEETIWTVNLYLGRDETIVRLASGNPADPTTPLSIRQTVLAMDEESIVAAEAGGIDARSIKLFDEWLTSDPDHLHQILPEPKGVVVLVPSRQRRDYGDSWAAARLEEANTTSHFIIRNGDNLYRMTTDLKVGQHLIPTESEFAAIFEKDAFGRRIEPGSDRWLEAEKRADAHRRHYMRIGLVLQGLVDRTTIFAPLPPAGLDFGDPAAYDDGRIVFVRDAEMALTTGHTPYYTWIRQLLAQLQPGMRVVGGFGGFRAYDRDDPRISPSTASRPVDHVPHTITKVGGSPDHPSYFFSYDRTDQIWDNRTWSQRPARSRASYRIDSSDRNVVPIDLVSTDELRHYLNSRVERHAYLDSVPLIKAALAVKEEEAAAEEPFRLLLAGHLAQTNGVSIADATAALPELIEWWKFSRKDHRPLVGSAEDNARAVTDITREHARRIKVDPAALDRRLAAARSAHPDMIFAALRYSDNALVVFEPEAWSSTGFAREVAETTFVVRHEISPRGKTTTTRWSHPGYAWRRWRILFSDDRWATWDHHRSAHSHLTEPEALDLASEIASTLKIADLPVAAVTFNTTNQRFEAWTALDLGTDFDPSHPLTGPRPAANIHSEVFTWERDSDGSARLVVPSRRYARSPMVHITDGGQPWRGRRSSGITYIVFESPVLVAASSAQDREWNRRRNLVSVLRRQSVTLQQELEKTWRDAEVAEARRRFDEDFGDPELWEGHLKALQFTFPFSRDSGLERLANLVAEGFYNGTFDALSLPAGSVREVAAALDVSLASDTLDGLGDLPWPHLPELLADDPDLAVPADLDFDDD